MSDKEEILPQTWDREKSESSTGFESMTIQIAVGHQAALFLLYHMFVKLQIHHLPFIRELECPDPSLLLKGLHDQVVFFAYLIWCSMLGKDIPPLV